MTEKTLDLAAVKGILKERDAGSHKGDFGRLLCLVGSGRYRGAAVLCVKGALACGAGLTAVLSVEKALAAVAAHCPEAILYDKELDLPAALDFARKSNAAVIGCGLTDEISVQKTASRVINAVGGTLVIDADGINMLSENIDLLKELEGKRVILTPHIGEFSRLTGKSVEAIAADRAGAAKAYAEETGFTVVLKSDKTVVAAASGETFVSTVGNSGLAKGGSGDLLSGAVGSFAAMGYGELDAALLGVFVHSKAADLCAELMPKHSMTASAVADFIPAALGELLI